MRFAATFASVWPFTIIGYNRLVRLDADELVEACGMSAAEAAELNSIQEDLGLLLSPRPGHWDRVAREIERRGNRLDGERASGRSIVFDASH